MKAKKFVYTKDMSREEWLFWRRKGLGGSDIGAICGVNPYRSKVVVYHEKIGTYTDDTDNDAMKAGRKLEPVLAEWFTEETGLKTVRSHWMFSHPQYDWALANIDRFVIDPNRPGRGILEIKTASEYVKGEWAGDEPPNHYALQLQWYLFVTGAKWGAFAVLIGGNKFRHFFVERDDELIAVMFDHARHFWHNNVLRRIPPEFTGHDSEAEMLKVMYPQSIADEKPLQLPNEALLWVEKLESWKKQEEVAVENKTKYQNMIKDTMKEAEVAFAGPHKITWKSNKNGVRQFKITMGKGE